MSTQLKKEMLGLIIFISCVLLVIFIWEIIEQHLILPHNMKLRYNRYCADRFQAVKIDTRERINAQL